MKPTRLLLLTLSASLLLGGRGEAQTIASPYRYIETGQEAGVFVGTLSPQTGRFGFGPDEGRLYGTRYAVELGGPFSLEGVARALSSERAVIDPRFPEEEWRQDETADVLLTSVDGRIKFSLPGRRTWHGLGPYVVAGGGIAFDLAGSSEVDEALEERDRFEFGTSFLGILGGGIRWVPSDHFVVRSDGALNLWQLDTPQGWGEDGRNLPSVDSPPESEWVSGLSLTLGVALRW